MNLHRLAFLLVALAPSFVFGQSTPVLEHVHVNGDSYPAGWTTWGLITHQLKVTVTSSSNDPVSKADDTFDELVSELSTGYAGARAIYLENFGSIAGGTDTSFLATSLSESDVLRHPVSPEPTYSSTGAEAQWRPRHPWFTKPLADDTSDWTTSTRSAKKWMRLYLARLKSKIITYNETHTPPHVKYPDRWVFDWEDKLVDPTDRDQLVTI
jgi:hypothetical protein